MKNILLITSSSYNNMLEKGGFGCLVISDESEHSFSDGFCKSTANRMELMAVIKALEELAILYPNESLNIELVSKLNYLTLSFAPNKLRTNIQAGESLVNYDLWKRIFDLGINHNWKARQVNSIPLERLHKQASKLASNSFKDIDDTKIDDGVGYSTKKVAATKSYTKLDESDNTDNFNLDH